MIEKGIYFISGIDTDCGKTFVTGSLARELQSLGHSVTTQKLIQTGCIGISEDILTHRQLMGLEPQDYDINGLTCPLVFTHPCSPHLAAKIDNREINLSQISSCTSQLAEQFDTLLIEGAGGLAVPILDNYTMADYAAEHNLPLIFVTSPKLGSINHTIINFEYCKTKRLNLKYLIYNNFGSNDQLIIDDTRDYIVKAVRRYFSECEILELSNNKFIKIK